MKSLLPIGLCLLFSTPVYGENLASSTDQEQSNCKTGLIKAIQRIESEPNIQVADLNLYDHRYRDTPFPRRSKGIVLSLEGENTINVMASRAILTEAANYIFTGCSAAGVITIGQYRTDLDVKIGLNSDQSTMFFYCVDAEDYQRKPVPWGKTICL